MTFYTPMFMLELMLKTSDFKSSLSSEPSFYIRYLERGYTSV